MSGPEASTATREGEADSNGTAAPSGKYVRKDKSLGTLCDRFLSVYGDGTIERVSLDDAATRLGVERRRIYDIANVLESVDVLERKAKNQYAWHGVRRLPECLKRLKEAGLKEFGDKFERIGMKVEEMTAQTEAPPSADAAAGDEASDQSSPTTTTSSTVHLDPHQKLVQTKSDSAKFVGQGRFAVSTRMSDSRREKSLGLLSQKFIQLFLASKANVVSLESAAEILLDESDDEAKSKTKVRRLYDIANILCSLHLLRKVHLSVSKKPAFLWLQRENSIAELIAQGKGLKWFDKMDDEELNRIQESVDYSVFEVSNKRPQPEAFPRVETKRSKGRPRIPDVVFPGLPSTMPQLDVPMTPEDAARFNQLFAFTTSQLMAPYPMSVRTDVNNIMAQNAIGNANFLHLLAQSSIAQAQAAQNMDVREKASQSTSSNAEAKMYMPPIPSLAAMLPAWGMSGLSYQNNHMLNMIRMYEASMNNWKNNDPFVPEEEGGNHKAEENS